MNEEIESVVERIVSARKEIARQYESEDAAIAARVQIGLEDDLVAVASAPNPKGELERIACRVEGLTGFGEESEIRKLRVIERLISDLVLAHATESDDTEPLSAAIVWARSDIAAAMVDEAPVTALKVRLEAVPGFHKMLKREAADANAA